jgi:hypothetical protein
MALIEINRNPSRRDLAWFGLVLLAFLGLVGLIVSRTAPGPAAGYIWTAGVVLAIGYYAIPPIRRPMFVGWMYLAYPVGYVMSHVLLGIIYFGVLTPVGLVLRAFGYDPMARRFDRGAPTYWVARETRPDSARYFRQF